MSTKEGSPRMLYTEIGLNTALSPPVGLSTETEHQDGRETRVPRPLPMRPRWADAYVRLQLGTHACSLARTGVRRSRKPYRAVKLLIGLPGDPA